MSTTQKHPTPKERTATADPKKKPATPTQGREGSLEKAAERTDQATPSERTSSTGTARSDKDAAATNTTPHDTFLGEGANEDERPTVGL